MASIKAMRVSFFIYLILFSIPSFSQTAKSIATGRPGQAIGGRVVGTGLVQIQSGYDYDVDDAMGTKVATRTLNNVVRLGLNESFEISTLVDYSFIKNTFPSYETSMEGLSQWQLGFRYNIIHPDHEWLPTLGLQTRFRMKQVSSQFKRDEVTPVMILSVQEALSDLFFLTVNGGINYSGNNDDPSYPWVISLSQSITSNVSFAYEAYGNETAGQNSHYWGFGIGWVLNPDLQLDGYISTGKNHGVDEMYASVGFSWRSQVFSENPF